MRLKGREWSQKSDPSGFPAIDLINQSERPGGFLNSLLKLRSDLDRLKDPATAPSEKRTAMQRLKSFLYASGKYAAKKVDEVGTQLLVSYLERLCGLS